MVLLSRQLLGQGPRLTSGVLSGPRLWTGLQGVRTQTGTLGLRGGWSRELERCTIVLLLAESLRVNVEADRDIWSSRQKGDQRVTQHEHEHRTGDGQAGSE